MSLRTIALLSPGDMGEGIGRSLGDHGYDVLTCLAGRGAETRMRAGRARLRDVADLDALVSEADLVLAVLPPEIAPAVAREVAAAMGRTASTPIYADCNAVSPDTSRDIGRDITGAGAIYVDGGIIGGSPGKGDKPVRIYVSGPDAALLAELANEEIDLLVCGAEIGEASAVKMCFAAVTKGTNALHSAALMAAEAHGVGELVRREFEASAPAVFQRMRANIPRLPADSARYVREMEEIAHTFEAVGVTPHFHYGARDVLRLMAATPLAAETRETIDPDRTMEQTIEVFVEHLPTREAAE